MCMCPNADTSTDAEIKALLFEKMERDYGERGTYAIEMLKTAEPLLEQPGQYLRQAEMAAYCMRQAVEEIFRGAEIDRKRLASIAKRAIKAKKRILSGVDQPRREDYQRLLNIIDDMDDFFKSTTEHEANLAATIKQRTKHDPVPGDKSILKMYTQLIRDLNKETVHKVARKPGELDVVRKYYNRTINVLSKILLPHTRLLEIVRLAKLELPNEKDADDLKEIMVSVDGFEYFVDRMVSSTWLGLMDPDMLKSISGDSTWLLRPLATHLKDEHVDAFVQMVDERFEHWVDEDAGLGELGFVGYRLKNRGLRLLVKALKKSESVRQECERELKSLSGVAQSDSRWTKHRRVSDSISELDHYALLACLKTESSNPALAELADHLMSPSSGIPDYHKTHTIPTKLVEGMGLSSAIKRIEIIVYKIHAQMDLRHSLRIDRLGTLADVSPDSKFVMNAMVGRLCGALEKARELGISTSQLIETLAVLPDGIRHRFVAWLYSATDDADYAELVGFIMAGCGSRYPTGDDDLLLDRMKQDGYMDDNVSAKLNDLINGAPECEKMSGHMRQWNLDVKDLRRVLWAHMLRRRIRLSDEWEPCLEILNPYVDEEIRVLNRDAADVAGALASPAAPAEYSSEDPRVIAAEIVTRNLKAQDLPGYASMFGNVPELKTAVKRNAPKWAENPIEIISILRHPAYVAGYFAGLASSMEELHAYIDRLISAVRFTRTHHWPVADSGSPLFGYDLDWEGTDGAGIKLISAMAEKNVPLSDGELSDAWDLLCEAVADRGEEHPEDAKESLIDIADHKLHTCALTAMMHLIVYTVNSKKDIPKKVLAVLTASTKLTGRGGKEHRVVLGMWLKQLHIALPDWFEQNEPFLLGNEVSEDLGQTTLDMHIQWGCLDEYVLEKYRGGVLDAVKRDVDEAIDCLLSCMFRGLDGYDPKFVAKSLVDIGPKHVSEAGKQSARLLLEGAGADHIRRGVVFWRAILDLSPKPEALVGYGWWVNVQEVSQDEWEELMLSTCEIAMGKPKWGEGKMEWAASVAERIRSSQKVTDAGLQILVWLLRGNLGSELGQVSEHAMEALRKSKDTLGETHSWKRLHEMLLEQDFHRVDDL